MDPHYDDYEQTEADLAAEALAEWEAEAAESEAFDKAEAEAEARALRAVN